MSKSNPAILAVIREPECIGCTKCIQACPFDAIIGAHNLMHTVITDACNGCKLCVAPCPVDCIDLIELPERSPEAKRALAQQSRERYQKHKARLARDAQIERDQYLQTEKSIDARKAAIQAALARSKK
jgi:electron transport complex protein RnfB